MKYGNLDKVDPLLTKLRISEGKHIPPGAASKQISQTNNHDLISRSKQRRDYLQSSYYELKKYQNHNIELEAEPGEPVEESRGTSYRTRKLWDFDNNGNNEEPSPLLFMHRTENSNAELWSATDVRREARKSITHQVQKDLLEMEQFNESVKKRITKHSHVVDKNDDEREEKQEERDDNSSGLELRLNLPNEVNKHIDDGYGKIVSLKPKRAPYRGINSEADYTSCKSEERRHLSQSRIQRIRELNKQNFESRTTRCSEPNLDEQKLGTKEVSNTSDETLSPPSGDLKLIKEKSQMESSLSTIPQVSSERDEIMPPPPRYLQVIKEMSYYSRLEQEAGKSTEKSSLKYQLSPRQCSSPPPTTKQDIGSPISYYESTKSDSDCISTKSTLSDGTADQRSGSSSSRSNNVAETTLSIILGRIEDAKQSFQKALVEKDIKKQADLANLITQLGEAAVAMRELEDL